MIAILQSLVGYLLEMVWVVLAAFLGSYFATWRARSRWEKSEFLDRLNVSLTTIDDGTLHIRTILEMEGERIFLNTPAANKVVGFAKNTTEDDPILPIPEEENWLYLNAILNEVSERFAAGQVKRDLGLPVERGRYLLCLTCEKAGPVRTQKVRAMLTRKDFLLNLPDEEPKFERPNHEVRWRTLHQMAEQYEKTPYRFIEVEICI